MLTPDKLRFNKVNTGRDEDRVYVLFSESREHRRFFWLQEPDADGDEAKVKRLRDMLKRPPALRRGGLGGLGGLGGMPDGMSLMQAMAAGSRRPGRGGLRPAIASGVAGGAGPASLSQLDPEQAALVEELLAAAGGGMGEAAMAELLGMGGGAGMHGGDTSAAAPSPAPAPAPASGASSSSSSSSPMTAADSGDVTAPAAPAPAPAPSSSPSPAAEAEGHEDDGDEPMEDDDGVEGMHDDDDEDDNGGMTEEDLAAFATHMEGMPPQVQAMLMQQMLASRVERTAPLSFIVNPDEALAVATSTTAISASLAELLPEGQRDSAGLEAAVRSPQLAQALRSLTGALSTDNFETIFANFGLDPRDGADLMARGDAVGAFLAALQAKADREVAAAGAATAAAAASSSSSSAGGAGTGGGDGDKPATRD